MSTPMDALVAKLEANRWNQSKVARELGVHRQTISAVLAGDYEISDELAAKLGFERVWRRIPRKRNGAQTGSRKASRHA